MVAPRTAAQRSEKDARPRLGDGGSFDRSVSPISLALLGVGMVYRGARRGGFADGSALLATVTERAAAATPEVG